MTATTDSWIAVNARNRLLWLKPDLPPRKALITTLAEQGNPSSPVKKIYQEQEGRWHVGYIVGSNHDPGNWWTLYKVERMENPA